jgi:hypothetical protein
MSGSGFIETCRPQKRTGAVPTAACGKGGAKVRSKFHRPGWAAGISIERPRALEAGLALLEPGPPRRRTGQRAASKTTQDNRGAFLRGLSRIINTSPVKPTVKKTARAAGGKAGGLKF